MISITKPRAYYSLRQQTGPNGPVFDLDALKDLFQTTYEQFERAGYFQEAFGYFCVDQGDVPGSAGEYPATYVYRQTRKRLWPICEHIEAYDEGDLFDLIEFLFDQVSYPTGGYEHQFNQCGWHYDKFDRPRGQKEYRELLSELLEGYGPGYQLNDRGEIMERATKGMEKLLTAPLPTADQDVQARVRAAIHQFQRYGSSIDDRRHAVADLAGVLEKIRPLVKEHLLTQDEKDLFALANQWGIRHFNDKQRTAYDPVWLSFMFYVFLAAIQTSHHLAKRKGKPTS
jgi:hypothetical protein